MINISVIVPVYNCEKYIENCVKSILNQSQKGIEVILVNDGSTDNSGVICDRIKDNHYNVVVVHQSNKGVAEARNAGLEIAKGKYIGFVDGDDYLDFKMYEIMMNSIEKAGVDLVVNSYAKVKGNVLLEKLIFPFSRCNSLQLLTTIFEKDQFIACWRCLFKKNIIHRNNLKFSKGRKYGEDQEFTYKYIIHCQDIINNKDAIYYYRIQLHSAMFKTTFSHFQYIDAMRSVEEYAKRHLPDGKRAKQIDDSIFDNRYVHGIRIIILNLLSSGEKVRKIKKFILDNGYGKLLNIAIVDKNKSYFAFWKLWNLSPDLCLYVYAYRTLIGSKLRAILRKKDWKV